jgi:predicted nucleic acid-binding protein
VLVEMLALVQRRLGIGAARRIAAEILPELRTHWVDEVVHSHGLATLRTAGRPGLSLVDCVSFEVMRRLELTTAFAFDDDFVAQGFRCLR